MHAFRRDERMTFSVELDAAPADTCSLALAGAASADALARRAAWLDTNAAR